MSANNQQLVVYGQADQDLGWLSGAPRADLDAAQLALLGDDGDERGAAAAAGTTEELIERRLAAAAMEERLAEIDERLARAQGRRRAAAALLEQGGTTPASALRVAPAAPLLSSSEHSAGDALAGTLAGVGAGSGAAAGAATGAATPGATSGSAAAAAGGAGSTAPPALKKIKIRQPEVLRKNMPPPLNGPFIVDTNGGLVRGQSVEIDDETGEVRTSAP